MAAERGAALTTQLLGFSRKQVTHRAPLDLNAAVEEVCALSIHALRENIEVKLDLAPKKPFVQADGGQVAQILINLVVNAGDAMPAGGLLHLATATEFLDAERAAALQVSPGEFASVTVRDNGVGIPRELLHQIFDPFFTTKDPGEGTGLGLSTVLRILREHQGAITVESHVGVGTTFEILLPRVEAPPTGVDSEEQRVAERLEAQGTILLVEDDPIIRDLVCEVLEMEGYSVAAASSPQEAVAYAARDLSLIDLLITDVVMTKISGLQLAGQFREVHPTLKVLSMSGYADLVLAEQGKLSRHDPLIRKPFGNDELLSKVRGVLASDRSS